MCRRNHRCSIVLATKKRRGFEKRTVVCVARASFLVAIECVNMFAGDAYLRLLLKFPEKFNVSRKLVQQVVRNFYVSLWRQNDAGSAGPIHLEVLYNNGRNSKNRGNTFCSHCSCRISNYDDLSSFLARRIPRQPSRCQFRLPHVFPKILFQ